MTKVEVFVSSICPHCPAAIQVVEEAKLQVSDLEVEICNVEEEENIEKATNYGIVAVPAIAINNHIEFVGAPSLTELLARLQ